MRKYSFNWPRETNQKLGRHTININIPSDSNGHLQTTQIRYTDKIL